MTHKFILGINTILTLVMAIFAMTNLAAAEKIRLALPSRSMGYLPMFIALHRGYLRDENIELELPAMLPNIAHNALLSGEGFKVHSGWLAGTRP